MGWAATVWAAGTRSPRRSDAAIGSPVRVRGRSRLVSRCGAEHQVIKTHPTTLRRIHMRAALLTAAAVMCAALVPSAHAANPRATRDVLVVSNNWAGTADLVDPRTFKRLERINVVPDARQRIAEIEADPTAHVLLRRHPRAGRRGPQPVRRRRLHLARRPLRLLLAAELRRRRRDRPEDRQDPLAHARSTATAPTTWRSPKTAGGCSSRPRPRTSST